MQALAGVWTQKEKMMSQATAVRREYWSRSVRTVVSRIRLSRSVATTLAGAVLLCSAGCSFRQPVEVEHARVGIVALSGPDEFEQYVLASAMPSLVVFHSPGCASCKTVMRQLPRIATAYAGRLSIYTMKTGTWGRLERDYAIRYVPSLLFFADGRVRDRLVGWKPAFWMKRVARRVVKQSVTTD